MCEYCDNSKMIISMNVPCVCFGKVVDDDTVQVIVDRGYLRLGYDDMECLDHGQKAKINYCPMCGEKLQKEKCTACNGSGWYDACDKKGRPIKCGACDGTGYSV
jgi:hypothetical protein